MYIPCSHRPRGLLLWIGCTLGVGVFSNNMRFYLSHEFIDPCSTEPKCHLIQIEHEGYEVAFALEDDEFTDKNIANALNKMYKKINDLSTKKIKTKKESR